MEMTLAENGKLVNKIKTLQTIQSEVENSNRIALSVDCVIFGFDENKLKVLLIRSDLKKYQDRYSLLGDLVYPSEDLSAAAYRILKQRTGLNDLYLEQVETFGSVGRHPAGRVVTVAYCSLVNVQHHKLRILENDLHWHDVKSTTTACKSGYRNIRLALTCCPKSFR
jgi:8-oxo-dGTP diphosphatase